MGEPAIDDDHTALHEGLLVAEKYRLVGQIGEGAMGSVWSATHVTLGHNVAIKFLHGNVASSAEPRARFEREARLAARLGEASRHITRVQDHGVTSEGTPFLVMEFLHGEGLEVRLKRERRLPIGVVAKITAQLCRALHVAHVAGVIHRDLKPANIFLTEDEGEMTVKLLDFGVAKATLENEENQTTRAGALIGTPNYMSPEQIVGDSAVDARSDLWAAAAIVYRMAVGRAPFGSGSLSELAMRIVSTEPPTPTTLAPDLPHEFDLWVQKGLSKRPESRFQTARELSDSLAMVAGVSAGGNTGAFSSAAAERIALQIGDSVAGLQHTVSGDVKAPSTASSPHGVSHGKKSAFPLLAAFAILVVGGVGLGMYAVRKSEPSPTPAARAAAPKPDDRTVAQPSPKGAQAEAPQQTEPPATASATTTVATTTTAAATTITTITTSAPPTKTKWAKPPSTAKANASKSNTDAPPATTAAPPPPPPTATTASPSDLWKKKDEM